MQTRNAVYLLHDPTYTLHFSTAVTPFVYACMYASIHMKIMDTCEYLRISSLLWHMLFTKLSLFSSVHIQTQVRKHRNIYTHYLSARSRYLETI